MRERGLRGGGRAHSKRRAWQIYVAHIFLFAIYMAEIAYVQSSFRQSDLRRGNERARFHAAPGRDHHPGAAAEIQTGPTWTCCRSISCCCCCSRRSCGCCSAAATAALGISVAALRGQLAFRLEPEVLSDRRLVLQSVRLAIAVRVRRLVRARRCATACLVSYARRRPRRSRSAYLLFSFAVTLTWHFPRLSSIHPALARRMDVSDRQDQSRRSALRAFPCAGGDHGALHSVTTAPWLKSPILRPAILCGQHSLEIFCLGVFLAFAAPFRDGRVLSRRGHAGARQRCGGSHNDRDRRLDFVVQNDGTRDPARPSGRRMPTSPGDRHEDGDRRLACDSRRRLRRARAARRCLRGSRLFCVRRFSAGAGQRGGRPRGARSRSSCSARHRRRCRAAMTRADAYPCAARGRVANG